MSKFFRWLWTGFGTGVGALQALGITIIILLVGVWVIWWVVKFFIWAVNKILAMVDGKKTNKQTMA